MARRLKAFSAAFEEEQLTDPAPVDTTPLDQSLAEVNEAKLDTVEAEADLDDVSDEVDDVDTAIDETEEAATALEAIADELFAAAKMGGIPPEAVKVVSIAVEQIYDRIGFSQRRSMPAMESFRTATRAQTTQYAAEGIMDSVKAIWAKIGTMMSSFADKAKEKFDSLVDARVRYAKRAEAVLAAVANVEGEASQQTVDLGKTANHLHVGGKVPENVVAIFKKDNATKAEAAKKAIEASIAQSFTFLTLARKIQNVESFKFTPPKGQRETFKDGKNDVEGTLVFEALGGNKLYYVGPAEPLTGLEGLKQFSKVYYMDTDTYVGGGNKATDTNARVLSSKEISEAATMLKQFFEADKSSFGLLMESIKLVKSAGNLAKDMAKTLEKHGDESAQAARAVSNAIWNLRRLSVDPITDISHMSFFVGKALLEYCEASLKTYSKKAAAPATPAEPAPAA